MELKKLIENVHELGLQKSVLSETELLQRTHSRPSRRDDDLRVALRREQVSIR